ncbi:LysR substrate-binding domain-containing protein [Streptomyces platensis subsp. malvinus]
MCTVTDHLNFSLTQLRYFVVSAELGNISEAAEQLCTSQSTISSALQRLERHLGVQLLLRHHARGVTLTPSGRRLLREAHTLLGQARNLKAQGAALMSDTAGQLDVGFFFPIAPFLLPLAYRMTKERHAALQLNVHEASAERLLELLQDGRCELVVTYDFLSAESSFHPLVDLPVYALLAEGDPSGKNGSVALGDLVTRPLVTLDSPSVLRHFEKLCANAGIRMPHVIRTTTLETMRGLVAAGAGFALMYQRAANTTTLDGEKLRAVEIVDGAPASSLGVAMMPGLSMSSRGAAFLQVLRSAISISYAATSRTRPGTNDPRDEDSKWNRTSARR